MARISKAEIITMQKVNGATDEEIGARFHVTRQAVHQLRRKYGIPVNSGRHNNRDKAIYTEYIKGGHVEKIADAHQVSMSQVYRIIKKKFKEEV